MQFRVEKTTFMTNLVFFFFKLAMHFELSTSAHYQAISHTDNSNVKFRFSLDLIIYVK